jgi:hypothetical protein
VQKARGLLELLHSIGRKVWQYIVTLDESWFHWNTYREPQWLPEDDERGTRTRRGIDRDKTILTIVWNVIGFHLFNATPKREKDNARYFIDNILTPLCG